MLVSVLIANYNYAQYLTAAIDSALQQTYRDVEVIVVDDGSTDESGEIIRAYGGRITSVFTENAGQTSALNRAFEYSRGELICLLDADDVFTADKVQMMVEAARRNPEAYLIQHQMQLIDAHGRQMCAPFPRRIAQGDVRRRAVRSGGWFPRSFTSGLTFRRSYAERMFPIPENNPAPTDDDASNPLWVIPDTYLVGPAALLAPVAGINLPLAKYRMHESNLSWTTLQDGLARYEAEVTMMADVMREKFNQSIELRVQDHLEYQLMQCANRVVSPARTAARVMRCESLPVGLRLREALRVAANRGLSARR